MTFNQKISAYTLGFFKDKDLPDIAITGLKEGFDSESLRILSGLNAKSNSFELNAYFVRAVNELKLTLKERKDALINVVAFYAKSIVVNKNDTYKQFGYLNEIINKTEFYCEDLGLMPCYADYISIWEEKTDGLDFHTVDGLTKEEYIEITEQNMRKYLEDWLAKNDDS